MAFLYKVLGSSSAIPTSQRYPSAHLISSNERFFLIDCGEGTQIQLRRFNVRLARINHILISHLHADHYLGLFGLISTYGLLNRKTPLHIHAFKELEKLINIHLNYLRNELSYEIIFHPLDYSSEQIIFEDKVILVKSFPLKHSLDTCGFVIQEKPKLRNILKEAIEKYQIPIKSIFPIKQGNDYIMEDGTVIKNEEITVKSDTEEKIAYCSDTAYFEEIIPIIKNADILIHESTFLSQDEELAAATLHSTATQAATMALKSGAKKLVITHFSTRYKDTNAFLKEAKTIFPETYLAEDGLDFYAG